MRSNKQTTRRIRQTIEIVSLAAKKAEVLLTLGLEGRQWLACALICAMLLPVFAAPVSAANVWNGQRATANDYSQFEPVNEPQPIWRRAATEINLAMERWLTPAAEPRIAAGKKSVDDAKKAVPKIDVAGGKKDAKGNGKAKDKKSADKKDENSDNAEAIATETTTESAAKGKILIEASGNSASLVKGIESNLSKIKVIGLGDTFGLDAIPLDSKGNPVHGFRFCWETNDKKIIRLNEEGRAVAAALGEVVLTARAGEFKKEFVIKVVEPSAAKKFNAAMKTAVAPAALINQLPIDEREWLFTPENNLGAPPGQTEPGAMTEAAAAKTRERAGIANFSFDIPVMGLSGRGMDTSVGITYNSRLWTKSVASGGSNHFTYDVENSWLAAGFNLSLGYLEMDYPSGQPPIPRILTDPNGTRHQLFSVGSGRYETADGTFIRIEGYTATYPDGTKIRYYTDLATGYTQRHYPTSITDRHGNVIYTVYESDMSGRLKYISDTMNRYIRFHYDTTPEKKLVAVTVPSHNAAPNSATSDPTLDRQTIRFYYDTLNLQYQNRFDGTTTVPNSGQIRVLKYVYFPGTKTGYRYDYSSYYGMIYKITKFQGMAASTTSLTQTGTLTEGQWEAWTKYNYPGTDTEPPSQDLLTDMPKYDKRFDEWQGRTGGGNPPETIFHITEDAANSKRTTKITNPDGSISETVMNLKPGLWDDGLIKETIIKNSSGQEMSKTVLTWEEGTVGADGRRNPRIKQVDATNETTTQTKKTVYEYVDLNNNPCSYNNVCQVKEYDFDGITLLRNTVTTYETGTNYITNRLLHLVKSVKVIVGGQTVSRTEYSYDTQSLTTYTDIVNFDKAYNPATGGPTTYCEPGCNGQTREDCCWTIPGWNTQTAYRGNITQIKSWADPANESDPLAETTVMKYDIAGNVVSATLNCCQLREWVYNNTNQYAYPVQIKNGQNGELSTFAAYDYNTGLMTSSKNENNQETFYQYEADTLRPKKTIYPNTGYVETEYSDKLVSGAALVPGFVRTTAILETNKTVQSYSYFNGRGQSIRTATETATDGWSVSAVEYDSIGRIKKSYNPFYVSSPLDAVPAGTKFTEIETYDGLGRATKVEMQDGSFVESFFNEAAVTFTDADAQTRTGTGSRVKDQAGKERRQIVDALGRVIRVDEPTTAGLGSATAPNQPTHYYYDGNNNLSKVVQVEGSNRQERKFKYDSLSRLTHEKQVEAKATLSETGSVVGVGSGLWTKVLKYDSFGRLTEATDARGVKTTFAEYDALNRIKKITFSDDTPQIKYYYDDDRPGYFNNGALTRVETVPNAQNPRADTPDTATEFDYDKMGQVKAQRQSIGAQTYALEYGYNLAGQLISEKYPSGRTVNVSYDTKGRLATIADANRIYLSGLQFQGKGNSLSQMTFGNGTIQSFVMNDRLQTESQELKRDSEVLQKYAYNYGELDGSGVLKNNGKLEQIESFIGAAKQWTKKFTYDSVGRLNKEEEYRGDNSALAYRNNYDYDRFGNLYRKQNNNPNSLSAAWIEDSAISKTTNQLTTNTTYDDAGNVTTDNKFRDLNYSYDANGRMYKTSSVTPGNQSNAVYDASGQRVATQVDGVWTFFIYDIGGKKVAEYGGLQATDEGGVKYVLQDWQGSSRAIVSNSGYVNARMDYTAFGEEIQSNIGQRTTAQGYAASNTLDQKYALTERDKATGLDHTWFRKLENQAGRWTSPDPYNGSMNLGNPQSFNRYTYVGNDPTNFVDPSGLLRIQQCTRNWWTDSNGNIHYTQWSCQTIYDDGGVAGGSSGGGTGSGNNSQDGISQDCIDALKGLDIWEKVEELLKNPPLFDVDRIEWQRAEDYFYDAPGRRYTVGVYFDSLDYEAYTIRGEGNVTGIYYRSSRTNIRQDTYLLLHEVVHLAYPPTITRASGVSLDEALVRDLEITQLKGESYTQTVSRFFNKKCDPRLRHFGIQP